MKYMPETTRSLFLLCPECGKEFYCTNLGDWVYKRTGDFPVKIFCSWTCMRKFDKRQEEMIAEQKKQGKMNHWRGNRIAR